MPISRELIRTRSRILLTCISPQMQLNNKLLNKKRQCLVGGIVGIKSWVITVIVTTVRPSLWETRELSLLLTGKAACTSSLLLDQANEVSIRQVNRVTSWELEWRKARHFVHILYHTTTHYLYVPHIPNETKRKERKINIELSVFSRGLCSNK